MREGLVIGDGATKGSEEYSFCDGEDEGCKKAVEKKIKVISLFSGCGGMDLGFEGGFDVPKVCIKDKEWIALEKRSKVQLKENPFEMVFCNDIMKDARVVFEANFPSGIEYVLKDVAELKGKDLPKAELVIGGFPCQDFSLSGKRRGFSVERGRLYQEMARIIREVKAKAFFAENVYGLLSIKGAIETIKEEFEKGGYTVFHYPVKAQDYGVPQTRKRVFFVGVKTSALKRKVQAEDFLPTPTHLGNSVPLKHILRNLSEPDTTRDPDQKAYSKSKFYGAKCQGNKAVDLSKPAPTMRAEHRGNIEFRRLNNEGAGDDRRLTVREVALIQTFPKSFAFTEKNGERLISQSSSYRVLGNAVPPLLAYHFARKLGEVWDTIF